MHTKIDYNESLAELRNPDRGFYTPVKLMCTESGMDVIAGNYLFQNNLIHLRISIGNFSGKVNHKKDLDFTPAMLSALDGNFSRLREYGVCAVVRFAYDNYFAGLSNQEPSMDQILRHIQQLAPILTKYPDVITALEVGMVGPWGEMHTSALAVQSTWNQLINAFLKATGPTTSILVRQPNFYYSWLGISLDELLTRDIKKNEAAYRVGLFNDGYLGSLSDLGTYRDRNKEIAWLSKQALHTPFGGEAVADADGSGMNKLRSAAKEMFLTHTAYLNLYWNGTVIDDWKHDVYTKSMGDCKPYYGETGFTFINNHLGYRFVLKSSQIPQQATAGKTVSLKGSIENVGFGNITKPKSVEILFTNSLKTYTFKTGIDAMSWNTCRTTPYTTDITLPKEIKKGDYSVFMRVHTPSTISTNYCIQFANDEIWNDQLNANLIGHISVK